MSATETLLTIVVPVFNREHLVRPTLDSIAAQTLRPLRIILVDNNSTDGTLETLRQWKREVETPTFAVDIFSETTQGAAAARECGLRQVTTEYTMFFDSDDLMAPVHAALAVDAFRRNPDVDLIGWDVSVGNAEGKFTGKVVRFYDSDTRWHNIMHGSLATQRYAARTSLFRHAGGWNPEVRGWDDIELGLRILSGNPKILKLTGEPTVIWRAHKDSISRQDFASQSDVWEHALEVMRAESHPRLRRYVGLKGAILAGDYAKEGESAKASALLSRLLAEEPSAAYRQLLRLAYTLQRSGLRSVARLLRPFY